MNGWVIVYLPGGNIYQMFDETPSKNPNLRKRLLHGGIKTFLAATQLWWWLRS